MWQPMKGGGGDGCAAVAQYGAVGLQYDGAEEGTSSQSSDSEEDEDAMARSEEEGEDEESDDETRKMDRVAGSMGLPNFAVMARRAEREEADIAAGRRPQRKCGPQASPVFGNYAQ